MSLPSSIQGISGLLRKAGHTPSVTTTTSVRGWHNNSYGYKIKRTTLDFVGIAYCAKIHVNTSILGEAVEKNACCPQYLRPSQMLVTLWSAATR
jgi:hypothetical protein